MKIKILSLAILMVLSASAFAQAQLESGNVPLFTTTVPLSTTTNAATAPAGVSLEYGNQSKRLAMLISYSLANTNNGTTLSTFGFDVSLLGTNWSTTVPLNLVVTNNVSGTNTTGWVLCDSNITQNGSVIRHTRVINTASNAMVINSLHFRFFP